MVPRPRLRISLTWDRCDDRAMEWYDDRRKYGFDERVLWCLSGFFETMLKDKFKVDEVTIDTWRLAMLDDELVQWYRARVERYVAWKCPYSAYRYTSDLRGEQRLMPIGDAEIDSILDRFVATLRRLPGEATDEDLNFLMDYDRFGY